MRAGSIRPGDTVEVNIRGWVFRALVLDDDVGPGRIALRPLGGGIGYRGATPRQVRRRLHRPPRRLQAAQHLPGMEAGKRSERGALR